MNRKTYRICLVMLIIAATISGIFYYRFIYKQELAPRDGFFVYQNLMECEIV